MKLRPTTRLSFQLASAIAALLAAPTAHAQWIGTTNGDWLTTTNWTGGTVAGSSVVTSNTDIGVFSAAANPTIGINMTTTGGVYYLGAIDNTNATARIFNNNSTTTAGVLTLNGATVNSFANTIIRNTTNQLMTITNGTGSGTLGLELGNATNNIIQISGTGGITINSIISGSGKNLTFTSTLGGTGAITLGGANTYTGATNILAGTVTAGNASALSTTSGVNLASAARLIVNATDTNLSKLATGGGGSGVVAGSFLRYSQAQTSAGALNGPGTISGTVELNVTNANPNYTLDFGSGAALTNLVTATYTSALTLSGTASIDASAAVATYTTGGITASSAGTKTLNLTGSNTGANTISGNIGNGSGVIGITKGGIGNWTLSGTNTYTGNTLVSGGILKFANPASLYNNGAAATWSNANIDVKTGATMAFNIGGADFTKANINTLLALSNSASNGFNSGSSLGLDTTNGSFLFDSVIANPNGGANVLGLTKLGTNTLTLDQNNTYTGATTISAGTLQLGNGGTTGKLSPSSVILNNGTLTINRSNAVVQGTDFSAAPITGTGAFIQNGTGIAAITTLNAANTFSGTTTVSGGVLNLTNPLALQNSALVTTSTGTVTFTGFTTPTFGGLSGATGDLTTVIPGFNSTTALTLNAAAGSFTYGGVISNGAGAMTLTKNGAGTQILQGANLYTGMTTINAGTLTVSGSGSLNGTTGTPLAFGGTGSFNVNEAAGSDQHMTSLAFNAGDGTVQSTFTGTSANLTFDSAPTRTAGATGTFIISGGAIGTSAVNANGTLGTNNIILTGQTGQQAMGVAYFAGTVSGNNYAFYDGAGFVRPLDYVNDTIPAGGSSTQAGGASIASTAYAQTTAAITAQTSATFTGLNIVNSTNTAQAFTLATGETVTTNGILRSGNGGTTSTTTISGGTALRAANNAEMVIRTDLANDRLTISTPIIANGTNLLSKSGLGILTLSGTASTYSGGTVINAGTLALTSAPMDDSVGTGPITVNNTGALQLAVGGTFTRNVTLNGGSLQFRGSGTNLSYAGNITVAANSIIDMTGNNSAVQTISGNTSGIGGLTITNSPSTTIIGALRLNGASNDYAGPTVVTVGGLIVKSSLYGNDTSKWTPANITVANGAALLMNVGGAGEFTAAQASTMFTNLATNVNNNGLRAGSTIGVDTRTAGANALIVLSGIITDSSGPGGGTVNFRHSGVSNTTLELTGANTYSGATIIDNNSNLRVSSLNSVFTNAALGTVHSASSSLGAPTTVANGTIWLGVSGSPSTWGNTFNGGSLIYTGTGEITDRVISTGGGGTGENARIDQSGTGLLKFISNISLGQDARGNKNFILEGSTSGTGEIAGVIPQTSSNNLSLTKNGTGTWTLSGANLYLGTTTVSGGTLRFARQVSLYNNDEVNWTKAKIIVNSTGTLALNVGGTGEFTTGNVTTLLTSLGVSINNNGLRSGSFIGFDTTNAAGGTFTVADTIANSTGTGSGAVGLTKLGTNTLVLTGPNTYTGATTVVGGRLSIGSTGTVNSTSSVTIGKASTAATAEFNYNSTTALSKPLSFATGSTGGTLSGTGTITPNVVVTTGNTLAPGNSIGALGFGGTLTLNAGSTASFEVDADINSNRDQATGISDLTYGGKLRIIATGTLNAGDSWDLFDFSSQSGTFDNNGSFGTNGSTDPDLPDLGSGLTWAFDYSTGTLSIVGSGGSPYDTWVTYWQGLNPGFVSTLPGQDPDNDGRNNLAEFAFDGNPMSGANDGKIVGKVATVGGNQVMTLTLPVRGTVVSTTFSDSSGDELSVLVDGIYYRIEGDVNLSTFADNITEVLAGAELTAIQSVMPPLSSGDWTYRTFRAPGTVPATPKAFLRAKVEAP